MIVYHLEIIGTHLSVHIDGGESDSTMEIQRKIEERLRAFEEKYSRFIPGNWLDTLNTTRQGILDNDGESMLRVALEIARETDGYFDPTIGSRLSSLGYGRPELGGKEVGWKNIILGEGGYIELLGESVLEFGGVGKGFLIDCIRGIINQYGYSRYLINFGGDMYGKGGWLIGLEHPEDHTQVIGTIVLDDLCIACSAGGRRKWGHHHHLIDPKTGESATSVVATYIEGNSGIYTDTLATALAVMPYELSFEYLNSRNNEHGVIVEYTGRYFQSSTSKSILFI